MKVLDQLETLENQKAALEDEVKERMRAEMELQGRNGELLRVIEEKEGCVGELEGKLGEWGRKWEWAFSILAGDVQRSDELIWMVKNQYRSGIWGIIA